ncbi:hypothetical protein [Actinophytocola xanthii]|uniref:Uncharacterized protein n=1 Tax=Actinophytocola xanthii TaxID=1912961 RepID=A0A1Q8CXE4_9PSEU|nr:hypothetical protein [Actinophytocola xanthii]OLF19027.1 hypothetical protein BU204_04040 [Actinophytocola xanthii]
MSAGRSRTGPGLVGAAILGLFTLICLVMAVGALVPAVGEVMGVRDHGVGPMFGYLAGAAVWGLLALLAVWAHLSSRREPAPPEAASSPTADEAAGTDRGARPAGGGFAAGAAMPLPDGPGLGPRRLLATPLALVAAVLPWFGVAGLRAWETDWFGYTAVAGDEAAPSFTQRWLEQLVTPSPLMAVPALVALYVLLRREAVTSWPPACALGAGIVLLPTALLADVPDFGPISGKAVSYALALALVGTSHVFARLAVAALTRPIAADVADSGLDVTFRLPGQGLLPPRPRLLVRQDRLVLSGIGTGRDDVDEREMPWANVTEARVETRQTAEEWTPVAGQVWTVAVPAGPVLLIRGRGSDWVLPFDDEGEARSALALMTARAGRQM